MCGATRWALNEVPRWGAGVHDKNVRYSDGNHVAMASDEERCGAFAAAIGRVAKGRRILDVGTGPFLLLARLCERAGAAFISCVEDSPTAIKLAIELLKREQLAVHPDSGWAVNADMDEECQHHLYTIRSACGGLLELRTLQLYSPLAPITPGTPAALASTCDDATVLALYPGLSSQTALPGGIELVVHEILGHVASSEGVVGALRELRSRPGLLAPGCALIPCAAGTMLAPTAQLTPEQLKSCAQAQAPVRTVAAATARAAAGRAAAGRAAPARAAPAEAVAEAAAAAAARGGGGAGPGRTAAEQGGGPRVGSVYQVDGLPEEALLAAPQPMEWYDFGAAEVEAGMPERQQRTLAFTTNRAAAFDGVHLHLRALLDADTALDARAQRTTWSCLYVRLLPTAEAVWLPAGSAIACRCAVDVAGECAHYAIEVEAAVPGEPLRSVASFAWSGDG